MLENFDIAEEALATSSDAAGSALAENEKYLESIEGKISQFQASWQSLSNTVVNSTVIKFIVDAGTKFVSTIDSVCNAVGGLGAALGAIPAAIAVSKIEKVSSALERLKTIASNVAGGDTMTSLWIRPPYRDGNIERAGIRRQGGMKKMPRSFGFDKWCA